MRDAVISKKRNIGTNIGQFHENAIPLKERYHKLSSLLRTENVCISCGAYRWPEERPGFCCEKGKISLPPLPNLPPEIESLYNNNAYLKNLRSYNNSLALASIGCSEQTLPGFSPTFKIQGKVFHRIGSILPTSDDHPKFAQIYFHDTENEIDNRLRYNPHLDRSILALLQDTLHTCNPYVDSFKAALNLSTEHDDYKLILNAEKRPSTEHARRYNLPTGSEVAVIMPGDKTGDLDVILQTKGGQLQRINARHRSYDPLHYVLLFPNGTDGYMEGIPHAKGNKNVSPTEFYRYRLQVRKEETNHLLQSRRLTQQYVTDAFVKVESERFRWVHNHQSDIRADKYKGLLDAVNDNDEHRAGTKVILPPSIYGSPRWYAEAFQDAMAIVRKYGRPHYFITFTCNPNWPEVKSSLFPQEQPKDRPDILARVFNIKKNALLQDLTENHVLGEVIAYTVMKEDQKRGLPHVHILLIMAEADRPREPSDIDNVISAQIPDKAINPVLHDVVTRHMIHGPCGAVNPTSPCMDASDSTKKCSKNYPKDLRSTTTFAEGLYPQYKRTAPEDGGFVHPMKIRGQNFTVDNRWIVPYNPYLSLKYNSHINVEAVISVSCVKYLYKYTCKGSDRVMMTVGTTNPNDEIERYVNARYVGCSEAYWRLYDFPILNKYPPVEKLPLHLEDEQTVLFSENNARDIANQPPPKTKLTEFFQLSRTDPDARKIIYPDVYHYYRWDSDKWVKRKRNVAKNSSATGDMKSDMIGRIPVINLNAHQTEIYYMRMLLYHVPGPQSYEDLRTIDGQQCPTYKETCLKLGILEDDREIDKALEEAASVQCGPTLRHTFATILMWLQPAKAREFWERHKDTLAQDIMHRDQVQETNENILNEVLIEIQEHLQRNGYDLTDFQIPKPSPDLLHPESNRVPHEIRDETNFDAGKLAEVVHQNEPLLNEEQRPIYSAILHSVETDAGELFAIDAPGGTGKTFLLTTLLAKLRLHNHIALATATSGIAATLLPNGRTLHSRCKVPIKTLTEHSVCSISKRSATAELFRRCKILIIDEVTMGHRSVYEAISRTLKDLRDNDKPFGGITVVFSGDWRQILPVVRHGSRADIVNACLKSSPLWDNVQVMKMATNMRVRIATETPDSNTDFGQTLLQIGEGKMPIHPDIGENKIKLHEDHVCHTTKLADLCDFVFSDLKTQYQNPSWLCSRAILCPTNQDTDDVNDYMTKTFPGNAREYKSADKLLDNDSKRQYPVEFLNSLCASGMPPHILRLKPKSPIMLLRNLDPANGHCNGTRYIITSLHDHVIEAAVAGGLHKDKTIYIPRIPISPSDNTFPFQMTRRQFPIRPCFAMTANKAQGQTLKKIGLFLTKDFFAHGQLYVAMSRVGQASNIRILQTHTHQMNYITNIVYKEIL